MGKKSEDWIPFHGWDSDDWKNAGRTALLTAGGIALGGVAGAALVGATAGAAGGVALGAAAGGYAGYSHGESVEAAEKAEDRQKKAIARQEAQAVENEIMRKSSLLAAQNTMTAREAMARNVNAAIKNMYRPKTASNNPTPYTLGGDDEVLG